MNLHGSCLNFLIWKTFWDGAAWKVYIETWTYLTYLQISAQYHDIWQNLLAALSRHWNLQFHQQELAQGLPWLPSAISIFSSINRPVCSASVKTMWSSVTQSLYQFIQVLFEFNTMLDAYLCLSFSFCGTVRDPCHLDEPLEQ